VRGQKIFTSAVVVFLAVITFVHILRIVSGFDVIIAGWALPFWLNGIAAFVTGGLSYMLWKENFKNN